MGKLNLKVVDLVGIIMIVFSWPQWRIQRGARPVNSWTRHWAIFNNHTPNRSNRFQNTVLGLYCSTKLQISSLSLEKCRLTLCNRPSFAFIEEPLMITFSCIWSCIFFLTVTPWSAIMSNMMFLGRVVSLVAAVLASCTVGPIVGFNVYFNAFKAQYQLRAAEGQYASFLSIIMYSEVQTDSSISNLNKM